MSDPRTELIESAKHFYHLGWMVGTAGNLSSKLSDGSFWITASGKSKGKLQSDDFVRIDHHGKVVESPRPENRPSLESSIHQVIYSLFPDAVACYHVHSVEANLVSRMSPQEDYLSLPPLEMLKGLGVWQEKPEVTLPLFENYLDVTQIARSIEDRFTVAPPQVPALLIKDHGVTVWGNSLQNTFNYLEVVEYIFRYILQKA